MKRTFWAGMGVFLLGLGVARGEMTGWQEEGDELPSGPLSTAPVSVAPVAGTTEPPGARPPLMIVHPPEGMAIPAVKSSFVYGWADPAGTLTVNGRPVMIYPGGGWLTMVPYTPGPFTLQAELRSPTTSYVTFRRVTVGGGGGPSTVFSLLPVQPDQDLLLRAGETVVVQAQGPPGLEGSFQWEGSKKRFPLGEYGSNGRGTYRGFFTIPGDGKLENASLRITLLDKKRGTKQSANAPGRVSRLDRGSPWVVEVTTSPAILRAGPGLTKGDKGGYVMFPPMGTRLLVTGRRGGELRVSLSASREAWIGVDEVKDLPETALAPRTTVTAISVETAGKHTQVRVYFGTKVPFEIRPSEDGRTMDVLFFGAVSNTDWIHYHDPQGAVRRVEWFQDDTDTYRLRVHLHPGRWWGYDARFDNGGFVLELRRPPPNAKSPSSLAGLTIAVDAGHSADRGAIGPTELLEKDANLSIAACLEKRLKQAGAEVVMIRKGDENVALYDRPKRAWEARADILISVHNNALPEGADPFERNGYGVYYFHPQSFALAQRVHEAYGEKFGGKGKGSRSAALRDDGLHYGNLALPRTGQMPAVLTESAYMILPEEEALLRTETFQCDCAEAMFRGLTRFVEDTRKKDTP
ncbi:MAG: N-acetylmuramoyl-L-alanine amidase [Elusimicrobia bacterium]|nr:N-acetylmuramoyl-L-alanine amidase [Elusimicrobiota bacterium]